MFLLALLALSVLALLPALCAVTATGSKAATGAADREGMPEQSQTNHPAHLREARVTSDASSRPARSGTCPATEGDDLETTNTTAALGPKHGFPPSASPGLTRGLALGVSYDWTGQRTLPVGKRAHGPDLSSCTASPRPRITCGDAERRRVRLTTPALR